MSELKLVVLAVSAEAASLLLLLSDDTSLTHFLLYLMAHGVAAALMALVAWRLLPLRFRTPTVVSWLLIFAFAFFIPAIGLFTLLGGIVVGIWLPVIFRESPFSLVADPYYTPVQAASSSTFRQIDIQSLLSNPDSPDSLRLQGMLVLKDMPARVTGKVLRESLGDNFEDIRLLSYGILDQKEKTITRDIDRLLQLLERAKESRRYMLTRRLSELYWELNYQDLVRGDIRKLTLEKAALYADMALMEAPQDAGIWVLRGRIQLAQGDTSGAQQSLVFARRLGLSASQVNPWLAEIAMERRQFPLVRRLMGEISDNSQFTFLNKSVEYWRSHGLSHR